MIVSMVCDIENITWFFNYRN